MVMMILKTKVCECNMFTVYFYFMDKVDVVDTYERHFGVQSSVLSESSRAAVDTRSWKHFNVASEELGMTAISLPDGSELESPAKPTTQIDVTIFGPLRVDTYEVASRS